MQNTTARRMNTSESSKYAWSSDSDINIEDFLKKTRPSIITDADAPWIWVYGSASSSEHEDPESGIGQGAALIEAQRLLTDLERRLKRIEDDDSIPVRAKKGVKSKKVVRDETYALLFPSHETVDGLWATLAKSVAKGPLSEAGVELAKVAPTPSESAEGEYKPHLICLYIPDVYDLKLVRNVLEVLLTQHGIEPSSVKSDLYTLAGIDSNHPTKLRSTIWRPHEVIEGGNEAIKSLKAKYKPTRKAAGGEEDDTKPAGPMMIDDDSEDERIATTIKRKASAVEHISAKPKPVSEEKKLKAEKQKHVLVKRTKSAAEKFKENDIFADPGDDSD